MGLGVTLLAIIQGMLPRSHRYVIDMTAGTEWNPLVYNMAIVYLLCRFVMAIDHIISYKPRSQWQDHT